MRCADRLAALLWHCAVDSATGRTGDAIGNNSRDTISSLSGLFPSVGNNLRHRHTGGRHADFEADPERTIPSVHAPRRVAVGRS